MAPVAEISQEKGPTVGLTSRKAVIATIAIDQPDPNGDAESPPIGQRSLGACGSICRALCNCLSGPTALNGGPTFLTRLP